MNAEPGPLKRSFSDENVAIESAKKLRRGSDEGDCSEKEDVCFQSSVPYESITKEGAGFISECNIRSDQFIKPVLEYSLELRSSPNESNRRYLVITTDESTPLATPIITQDIKTEPDLFPDEDNNICFSGSEPIKNVFEIKQETTPTWTPSGKMKTIEFTHVEKLLVPPPSDPLEAFRLLLNDDILNQIVLATNLRAEKEQKEVLAGSYRSYSRTVLTPEELLKFLALLLHMGTIRLNRTNNYWKKHWLFNIPCFAQYMTQDRFMLILRCLSFSSEIDNSDRFAMFHPMIQHFNKRMEEIYCPGKQLTLDRSMMICKRNGTIFRKSIKKGKQYKSVTMHALADIEGIVLKCHIYDGATKLTLMEDTEATVLNILEEKLDSGYSVYMDSYYSSYDLAKNLLDRNTYCTGILSKDKTKYPVDFNSIQVEEGENNSLILNDVHLGKWMNKLSVAYMSTEHDDEMVELKNIRDETIRKPSALVHYNNVMSGVKLQDKMLAYYPSEMALKNLRLHKKLFIHLLQICLSNAFYLYNKYSAGDKMTFFDFRLSILEKILPNQSVEQRKVLKLDHNLTKIEVVRLRLKKDGNQRRIVREVARKECRGCKQKLKKRVSTIYECKACEGAPGYCTQCFCIDHS